MTSSPNLVALQFQYANRSFENNFETLSILVENSPQNSIILAPELCLSGYDYENLEKNTQLAKDFMPKIKALSEDKIFSLTIAEEKDGHYFNNVKIFHNKEEIYSRAKARLFSLGNEEKYFTSGKDEDIKIVQIDGVKIAILLCFELRYIELWEKAKGADIILIPAYWAKKRKLHLEALSKAVAIMNQCFVIIANSSDEDMASSAGIINPFGEAKRDDSSGSIIDKFDLSMIKKMRRYINIGLT
ncbi:MAG: carbon-nitrogen hydrolase family protein [Sulfurospirillaceae bacterium]|nr:carbon-nitrogen hydrolase family protein [Sulfurospirillaceae bacterium]